LGPGTTTNDISPYIGAEVTGIQISQLNNAGLDELALYAADRKVLIFSAVIAASSFGFQLVSMIIMGSVYAIMMVASCSMLSRGIATSNRV
jgi:hypothetical protein